MPWRLTVIDGADINRFFPLPAAGTAVIGNSHRHSDICLHDLFVSRVHCEVETDGDRVVVKDAASDKGILVNGQKVNESELRLGDVVRVGNSYLRLEVDVEEEPEELEVVEEDEVEVVEADELPELPPERLAELVGRRLAHYEILSVLGTGFHGMVFRAHDHDKHRDVAVRVLYPDFPADADELSRFARVVQTIVPLHHPNLVDWSSAGKSGPYCWVAMELIEGESLKTIFARSDVSGKMNWRMAARLARDVGKALEFLHAKKVYHGNITPANLIMSHSNRQAKLNDLRFHQALDKSVLRKRILEKKMLAELPFLPPERLESGAFKDEFLADIYSLGVSVYARLTGGHFPFVGRTPAETIERIRAMPIEKPRKLMPSIPEEFQNIVLKMLARSLEDRYQSASQIVHDVERLTDL